MHSILILNRRETFNVKNAALTHAHTQQDSPTFPLYTEVMSKGKAKPEEGEGSPEVPQKKLTEDLKELNLPTAEETPTVPKQKHSVENMQQMDITNSEVFNLMFVNKERNQ